MESDHIAPTHKPTIASNLVSELAAANVITPVLRQRAKPVSERAMRSLSSNAYPAADAMQITATKSTQRRMRSHETKLSDGRRGRTLLQAKLS
jgi:hypothetical protein